MAAIIATCTLSLVSCAGNKTDEFINDYEKLCNKAVEAVESGDPAKAMEFQPDVSELEKKYLDLIDSYFTLEQKNRLKNLL